MVCYRTAGQEYTFSCPVPELQPFEIYKTEYAEGLSAIPAAVSLYCRTTGWIGEEQREVECWFAPPGMILRVAGGSDFYISSDGRVIVPLEATKANGTNSQAASTSLLSGLDREILAGPALVLALALRGTWCLHASAAIFKESLILFLGESGQGKSTLAAYLATAKNSGWRLVADDILPVTMAPNGVIAWPRFPQLKLPSQSQPGVGLPEQISVSKVCVLKNGGASDVPGMQLLPAGQSAHAFLSHTAGTRLFEPDLLAKHLTFCTQAAGCAPVYNLAYTHKRNVLPGVRQLLEGFC